MKTAGLHIRDRLRHEGLRVLSVCCILLFASPKVLNKAFNICHLSGSETLPDFCFSGEMHSLPAVYPEAPVNAFYLIL